MQIDRLITPRHVSLTPDDGRSDSRSRIVGYAAVFYDGTPETEFRLWDKAVERIMPGAFDAALSRKDDVRALFNHDANEILGRTTAGTLALRTDPTGLWYEIQPPDTAKARDLAEHIRRGDISGSSFSFIATDIEWRQEEANDIREIRAVELFDVGPVTFPAYEATQTALRSWDSLHKEHAHFVAERSAGAKVYTPHTEYLKVAARVEALTRSIYTLP